MGALFPVGLADSVCQPFIRPLPHGGSWPLPEEAQVNRKATIPVLHLLSQIQAQGLPHSVVTLVERQGQTEWQVGGISHHTGNKEGPESKPSAGGWWLTGSTSLGFSLFQACILLHLDRYMWQSKVGLTYFGGCKFSFHRQPPDMDTFPTSSRLLKRRYDSRVICLMS